MGAAYQACQNRVGSDRVRIEMNSATFCRDLCAREFDLRPFLLQHLGGLAHELQDQLQLFHSIALALPFPGIDQRLKERAHFGFGTVFYRAEDNPSAILLVVDPAYESRSFEPIGDAGDCATRESGALGKFSGRKGTVVKEQVQALVVTRIESKSFRDRGVEEDGGAALQATLLSEGLQQLITSWMLS